ncbi:unnamed protein product (mitochondrion) [Plasmodiophora brassicae]|uniref:Histone-lysine N-methyltransferase n=1 Tax=Plasmodiophora brassicae TaxID=37360 RepID=A0A0G4ISZ8_PLABS|nr:hypothetical protein PBRA_006378 [Plasmodiophora brassicae]SPQ95161.1 unnamed protein product [Plasmodiophora brassicae]
MPRDLSGGVESMPVPCDDRPPPPFRYIRLPDAVGTVQLDGCACESRLDCMTNSECYCASAKGVTTRNDVRLPLFECNSLCGCGPDCPTRVGQNGLRFPVRVVYNHRISGWAVESVGRIPAGAFIVEYLGRYCSAEDAARLHDLHREPNYLLNVVEFVPSSFVASLSSGRCSDARLSTHIDASECGNVSRFFNHSCEPNLAVRTFRVDWLSPARVGFFAARDIEPGEELEFSYGDVTDQGRACHCGKPRCRKWLPFDRTIT